MGEHMRVDGEGLVSQAGVCDTAALAIPGPAASAAGHSSQTTAAAVVQGQELIEAVEARLSGRAAATGAILRSAAVVYVSTDGGNAQSVGAAVQF